MYTPYSIHKMATYPPGDFSFLLKDNDSFSRMWAQSCEEAYRVCENNELWSFFKNFTPPVAKGYMWWAAGDLHYNEWKRVNTILSKIDKGHSGASWACLMRAMEKIAKKGWHTFVKDNAPAHNPPVLKKAKIISLGHSF